MKIQLKRSNILNGSDAREPTAEQMEYGELAVNYNTNDPAIFLKDSDNSIKRIAGLGSVGIPALDNANQQPGTLDDRYVNLTGDTMTGNLVLPGGGSNTEALQKQEVEVLINNSDTGAGKYVEVAGDSMTGNLQLPGGGGNNDALQKQEVQTLINNSDTGAGKYVEVAGDNMTGNLTLGTSNIVLNASNGSAEFTSVNVDNLTLDNKTLSSSGTLNIDAGGTSAIVFQTKDTNGSYTFRNTADTLSGRLQFNDITAQRTYKYPDADGTVVVKDSTSGALSIDNLTLDGNTLSSSTTLNIDAGGTAAINFKSQATSGYRFNNPAETFYGALKFSDLTSNRTFNFPDEAGTVVVKGVTSGELTVDNLTLGGSTLSCTGAPFFQTGNANGNYNFRNTAGTFYGALRFNDLTANRIFDFPNEAGTVVVKDSTTGALTVDNLTLDGNTLEGSSTLNLKAGGTGSVVFQTSNTNGNYQFEKTDTSAAGYVRFENITANRFYDFPDETGTVVVKDNTTGALTVDNLTLDGNTLSSTGTNALAFQTGNTNGNYTFYNTAGNANGLLRFNDLTASRIFRFPDETGTVVLKDSTTGALNVDNLTLDASTLSSSGAVNIQSAVDYAINFKSQSTSGYRFYTPDSSLYGVVKFDSLTGNRTFNFPNSGGTIALTSDISDVNLKENITDAPSQWADVKATRVTNFEYTEASGQPSGKHIGWIAQEVKAISPGCVEEISEVDDEGNPTDESCLAIKTQVMLVKAYKALQEAMERIEVLEEKINSLTV